MSSVRPFRTDASAINCIVLAAEDVTTNIILLAKGTLEERERLATDIRWMRKEMAAMITESGREGFEIVLKKWSSHELMPLFISKLNRHLSAAPAPRRRFSRDARGFMKGIISE